MRNVKFFLILMLGFACTAIWGTEETPHTPYIGYDFSAFGLDHPTIGYRYKTNELIFDGNVGYKYIETYISPVHIFSGSLNAFYTAITNDISNAYFGIGCSVEYINQKTASFWNDSFADESFFFFPSVTIGHDFLVANSRKLFLEIYYKPVIITKNDVESCHLTGMRMGIGF